MEREGRELWRSKSIPGSDHQTGGRGACEHLLKKAEVAMTEKGIFRGA